MERTRPAKSGGNPNAPKISKIRTVAIDTEKLKSQELPRFKKSIEALKNYGMTLQELATVLGETYSA